MARSSAGEGLAGGGGGTGVSSRTGSGGGGTAYVNVTGIEQYLAAKHGSGSWGAEGSFTIVGPNGSATPPYATEAAIVTVKRGDKANIPYKAGISLVGKTVYFGGKKDPTKTTNDIAVRDVTAGISNPSAGTGLISLSATDTASIGEYICELEADDGAGGVITPLTFRLRIVPDVIRRTP
jgi:hypothetical protein